MIIPHIFLRSVTGFDFAWRARTQTTSEEDNLVQFGGESATWLLVWVHVSNVGGSGVGCRACRRAEVCLTLMPKWRGLFLNTFNQQGLHAGYQIQLLQHEPASLGLFFIMIYMVLLFILHCRCSLSWLFSFFSFLFLILKLERFNCKILFFFHQTLLLLPSELCILII